LLFVVPLSPLVDVLLALKSVAPLFFLSFTHSLLTLTIFFMCFNRLRIGLHGVVDHARRRLPRLGRVYVVGGKSFDVS
jgi:hypothetical protein